MGALPYRTRPKVESSRVQSASIRQIRVPPRAIPITMSIVATSSPPAAPAVLTLAQRELVRIFRHGNRVYGALCQPLPCWLLFREGLRRKNLDCAFFLPGTLVMILLFTAIFGSISVLEARNEGSLQSVL